MRRGTCQLRKELQMTAIVCGYLQEGKVAIAAIQTNQHCRRQYRPVSYARRKSIADLTQRVTARN